MNRAKDRWSSSVLYLLRALAALLLFGQFAQAQEPENPQPRKFIVRQVVIQGNRRLPTEHVLNYLHTRPGKPYDTGTVNEDTRRLYDTRQFRNVQFTVEWDKPASGECIVHCSVSEVAGTIQMIEYQGADHSKDLDLEIATTVRKGDPMNPDCNRHACQSLEAYYHDKGRPFAQVQLIEGNNPSDTRVVFNIIEGPKVYVQATEFTGNTFASAGQLRTHLVTSRAFLGLGGQYQQAMVLEDKHRLMDYYKGFGFQDVRVDIELVPAPDYRMVTIVYHIQEGLQYRVANHQVNAPDPLLGVLIPLDPFRGGETYDHNVSQAGLKKMEDMVSNQGIQVRAEEKLIFGGDDRPGVVDIVYQLTQTAPQPLKVGDIKIIGNDRTREHVIRRQLQVYPGQILSGPDMRLSEKLLERLGIFENNPETGVHPTVEVLPPDDPNSPFRDLLVTVKEMPTGSLLFGVGVNSDSGLTGSIALNERNFDITNWPTTLDELLSGSAFRGAGQEFRVEAVPGTIAQRYSVSFREPYLFDSPYSMKIDAYYYDRIYNEYEEDRLGGRITFGRRLDEHWTASVATRLETVGVFSLPAISPVPDDLQQDLFQFGGNHFLAGIRGGLTYDGRDSYLRPTEGFIFDIGVEECLGDYTFTKATAEASQYFTLWKRNDGTGKHVIALRSQVDWASADTPVYERYYAGGFQSMRGFEFRGVGPDDESYKVGGDFMWLNSIEYQIPILANDHLYAVAFVDSGNDERSVEVGTYRVAAGFGLRVVVPMLGPVPIALDFGFPIVKADTDYTQVFSFWLGFFH